MTGSCLRVRAIAAAFAAVAVAGCSADLTRFDADPFARATQSDVSQVSFTGAIPSVSPGPELRPKADLLTEVRPPAITGRDNAAVRVAALGDVPVWIPPREAVPPAVSAARNADASPRKEAKPKRKIPVATTRRSPAPPAHKTAARRPVAARDAEASAIFDWGFTLSSQVVTEAARLMACSCTTSLSSTSRRASRLLAQAKKLPQDREGFWAAIYPKAIVLVAAPTTTE